MANKKKKKSKLIHRLRMTSQTLFLFLLNPNLVFAASQSAGNFVYGDKGFCFPVMNCWACPAVAFGCPIGALGQFFVRGLIPFLTIGLLVLAGALIGRMLCGWVCPFGFLQDLMHKIRIPGVKKKPLFPQSLRWLKYAFLVVTAIYIPIAFGIHRSDSGTELNDFFFCNICPAGSLEAAIPVRLLGTAAPKAVEDGVGGEGTADAGAAAEEEDWFAESPDEGLDMFGEDPGMDGNAGAGVDGAPQAGGDEDDFFDDESSDDGLGFLEEEDGADGAAASDAAGAAAMGVAAPPQTSSLDFWLFAPRMWILYAFLALFILYRRPFCRGMCPIGAVFAIFNRFSFLRLRVQKDACKACNVCAKSCPVNNKVFQTPGHQDCVKCLECINTCQRGGVEAGLVGVGKREEYWE